MRPGTAKTLLVIATACALTLVLVFMIVLRDDDSPQVPEDDLSGRLDRLRSLPYTSMTADEVDTTLVGVVINEPDLTWTGYNLYGAEKAGQVILMDMDGRVVHRWSDPRDPPTSISLSLLLPTGDVIVLQRVRGLMRLDRNSEIVWTTNKHVHHELTPVNDTRFYTLEVDRQQYRGLIVRFDTIALYNVDGEVIDRWSTFSNLDKIMEAFDRRSFLDTILDSLEAAHQVPVTAEDVPDHLRADGAVKGSLLFDYFHANTISLLPETPLGTSDPRFRAGNLLICFRNVNQIAILDRESMEILWVWGEGILQAPHHPTMLESGNILIYDNGMDRNYTRILEVNPLTRSIEWTYGEEPEQRFFSRTRGSSQRLPNGNTLVCDSDNGRAFEITKDGEIVWEWLNPALKKSRRVQVYRMIRLDPSTVEPLLRNEQSGQSRARLGQISRDSQDR